MSTMYDFDHLVVMGRDQMVNLSQRFEALGFHLTPTARHNLGSMNRLIMLNTAYVELLGWGAGELPARKEIADEPIGLNALVFRTQDAQECHRVLEQNGYCPNPVQALTRPVDINGGTAQASFRTVRFSTQPIAGLRIYFCQHLTPEYVWRPEDQAHPNGLTELVDIVLESSDPSLLDSQLRRLLVCSPELGSQAQPITQQHEIALGNCRLRIVPSSSGKPVAIQSCGIGSTQRQATLRFGNEILQ